MCLTQVRRKKLKIDWASPSVKVSKLIKMAYFIPFVRKEGCRFRNQYPFMWATLSANFPTQSPSIASPEIRGLDMDSISSRVAFQWYHHRHSWVPTPISPGCLHHRGCRKDYRTTTLSYDILLRTIPWWRVRSSWYHHRCRRRNYLWKCQIRRTPSCRLLHDSYYSHDSVERWWGNWYVCLRCSGFCCRLSRSVSSEVCRDILLLVAIELR